MRPNIFPTVAALTCLPAWVGDINGIDRSTSWIPPR
jgi:hypothetical protein